MDTFVKAIGDRNAAAGKTKALGGIEERQGATARGSWYTVQYTLDYYNADPNQCTVTLMIFGKVGRPTARMLYEKGFKVIAVTDSQGGVYDEAIANEIVADFIFEAANDPAKSSDAYPAFRKRGIVNMNDFIANKVGLVVSYAELNKLLQSETLLIELVERVLTGFSLWQKMGCVPRRTVALDLARNHISLKIEERKRLRRY